MPNLHDADTVKLPPPLGMRAADADKDGRQDRVGLHIDRDGDGKPDEVLESPAFVAGGHEWFRGRRIAPDPEPPTLGDVIRTASVYELGAITKPVNAWIRWLWSFGTAGVGSAAVAGIVCWVLGFNAGVASVAPGGTASRELLETWRERPTSAPWSRIPLPERAKAVEAIKKDGGQ